MFDVKSAYMPKIEKLKSIISKPAAFPAAMELALEVHALTHCSEVSDSKVPTYEDEIRQGIAHEDFAKMPGVTWDIAPGSLLFRAGMTQSYTLAWHFWHIARIEDLVGNILIKDAQQIFNADWAGRLETAVTDTGNAMTDAEVAEFSQQLQIDELKKYRAAVGRQTRAILKTLAPEDMRRKVASGSLARIMTEGGVTEHKESKWLLDFWGKKTVGGLILLPLTRHHVMHLDVCAELKEKIKGK